jgi:hypothetical protein
MIDYVLEDNRLTQDDPNDRYARVVNVHSFTENDLAEAIAKRNLGISKPEALAMLEAASEIQLEWLASGNAVNLKLAHYHYGIPGAFKEGEHPTEAVIHITPSKELAAAAKQNTLRHVEPTVQLSVDYVDDVKSGTTNEFITKGGNVKIFGHNLKIAGTKPGVGIEFISVEDPEAIYPVPAVDIIINNPSELLIVAPQMVTNEPVQLKITTQYAGNANKLLKEPRSVIFDTIFTVEE